MDKETRNKLLSTLKERKEDLKTYFESPFLAKGMKKRVKEHLEATTALIEKINELTK